jgi:hypothetical protein
MACAWSSAVENGSQQFALLRINAKFAVEPDLTLARPSTCSKFSSFPTNGRKSICRQWTTTNSRKTATTAREKEAKWDKNLTVNAFVYEFRLFMQTAKGKFARGQQSST